MSAEDLIARLRRDGVRLAVAESCTGGLLGATLTNVPGSSKVFQGGIIAYDNDMKQTLLGVSDAQLKGGAVSAVVVEAMAHGARDACQADMAIAVSGVAGPTGGSERTPVGTVWLAVCGPGDLLDVHKLHLDGDRGTVRAKAVAAAIAHAMRLLDEAEKEDLL